jgi:peptidoglycan/LPS O-acetylase OafA/YrhL
MSQIRAIQILRALAALMVVFSHAEGDAQFQALRLGGGFVRDATLPWVAGVDLFFVTSGFIMVHSSRDLFGARGAARAFLTRRLVRIVPLYWLATAIGVAIALAVAKMGKAPAPPLSDIFGSLAFFPFARAADGQVRPIAAQGWTLNYEMFFYALFALFIRFERGVASAGVAAALIFVVAWGALAKPENVALAFWGDPIVLEFALGIGVALLWDRGVRLPPAVAAALALCAVFVLWLDIPEFARVPLGMSEPDGFPRLAGCGAPMALLFGAAVLVEPAFARRGRVWAFASAIGDASFALYLFHPLVIIGARKACLAAGCGYGPMVAIEVVASVAAALLIYHFGERPVTRALRRAAGGQSELGTARGLAPTGMARGPSPG